MGIDTYLDFYKINITQVGWLAVKSNGIADTEMIVCRSRIVVVVIGKAVLAAEIVRIPPVISRIDPICAVAGGIVIAGLETGAPEGIAVLLYPFRIIIVLTVERTEIIYLPAAALVVGPGDSHGRGFRTIISHGIVLTGLRLAILGTLQFIPCIVGQSVSVLILHDPYYTRF